MHCFIDAFKELHMTLGVRTVPTQCGSWTEQAGENCHFRRTPNGGCNGVTIPKKVTIRVCGPDKTV